ncbi:MAG: S41 family peptidase [Clostridiales bacterium]|jgi:hypothetical protein|nr:S41 family peptidase [Clostridiales bacterium]
MSGLKWRNLKKRRQKPNLSVMDKLRRKYLRFKIVSLSIIAVLAVGLFVLIYTNYDYLIFKTLIAGNYIHTDTLDEMFTEHLGFVPARYGSHFDNLVISIVTGEIRRVGGDVYTYMYTPTERIEHEERVFRRAQEAEFRELTPYVAYLRLPNISPFVEDFVFENRREIAEFDNLILDLRGNGGGELAVSQAIAGLFLERRQTVGFEQARMDFWPFSRERRARGAQFFEFENIVILQDGRTASAAESLIAALSGNLDNVTTVGDLTFGKAIGQVTVPLRRGFAVRATVILIETPDRESIHNTGLSPDIGFGEGDPVEFALSLLNQPNNRHQDQN